MSAGKYPKMFTPIRIGNFEVPNRICHVPTDISSANPDGSVNQRVITYHEEIAKGGFDPKVAAADFRTIWTAGSGWGTYAQKISAGNAAVLRLEAGSGELTLKEFSFTVPPALQAAKVKSLKGTLGNAPTKPAFKREGTVVRVLWPKPVVIKPGEPLTLEIQF